MCLQIRGGITVAAAAGNKVTLLSRCAYAAAAASVAGRAALGLALVILKHEQVVGTELNIGTQQRLIWRRTAPVRQTIRRLLYNIIVRANRLVVIANRGGIIQHVINESLGIYHRVVGESIHHQEICQEEQTQHYEYECNSGRHLL